VGLACDINTGCIAHITGNDLSGMVMIAKREKLGFITPLEAQQRDKQRS